MFGKVRFAPLREKKKIDQSALIAIDISAIQSILYGRELNYNKKSSSDLGTHSQDIGLPKTILNLTLNPIIVFTF
jgi:hypothetical protein